MAPPITPGTVNAIRLRQGRERLASHGAKRIQDLPDNVILWYADTFDEVYAQLSELIDPADFPWAESRAYAGVSQPF